MCHMSCGILLTFHWIISQQGLVRIFIIGTCLSGTVVDFSGGFKILLCVVNINRIIQLASSFCDWFRFSLNCIIQVSSDITSGNMRIFIHQILWYKILCWCMS